MNFLLDSNACIRALNDLKSSVAHNTREFSRVEGLQIEDWEKNEEEKEKKVNGKTR